ncbi:hypothetical protein N7462_007269 [Penicillium macrosclerotiorum]|uniref:uncharacterized protein n=1 Tax=Penicillium macrosclerotiorum TaxID=303699 RepID=UPI0025498606|nr:uncharacterized protein N7462_007269 [Penicillium macrosclerotiorum]KAJ5679025.1 hypothetical protein N7462_007269 [Penicillium macrosclerotiorum]
MQSLSIPPKRLDVPIIGDRLGKEPRKDQKGSRAPTPNGVATPIERNRTITSPLPPPKNTGDRGHRGKGGSKSRREQVKEFLVAVKEFDPQEDIESLFAKYDGILVIRNARPLPKDEILLMALVDDPDWTSAKVKWFLQKLLPTRIHLLDAKDCDMEFTPLLYALVHRKDAIVEVILEQDNLSGVLEATYGVKNCLQFALQKDSPCLETLAQRCKSYADLFMVKDSMKNTPLHWLMWMMGEEHLVGEQKTHDHVSHAYYSDHGEEDSMPDVNDYEAPRPSSVTGLNETTSLPMRSRLKIIEHMVNSFQGGNGSNLLQELNESGHTPYRLRVERLRVSLESSNHAKQAQSNGCEKEEHEKALRKLVVADPIAGWIRDHCMRWLSHSQIIKSLYTTEDGK